MPSVAIDKIWTLSDLYENIDSKNNITIVGVSSDASLVQVVENNDTIHSVDVLPTDIPTLEEKLIKNNIRFGIQPQKNGASQIGSFISNVLFPSVLIVYLFAMFRSVRGGNGGPNGPGPMNMFGGGESNIDLEVQTGITFNDVAGCDESKLELQEIVDFLKHPENYNDLGAICPKGALLEGPPGTGKTLLARAVAGEAGVPFISATGSEFVEVYVGVGASRVRKLFADAKKNSPCIIFIDEIDSIGRSRGSSMTTNDEREQTLNQILAEMDGFSGNTGVIVLAATNRADILDKALLRPGRFDRRVPVGLPDMKGRQEILDIYAKNKPFDKDVKIKDIAKQTIGFSGASLKNLLNEAAIVSARNNKKTIGIKEIEYAIDRITVGIPKPIGKNVNKQLVAYHEAGHALTAALIPNYDNVAKVTIIPRSNGAGGFTLFTPSEERMESGLYSQKYLKNQLIVALGGRVAEELVYGEEEITTGASADLQQVRNLARTMVTELGFRNQTSIYDAPIAWESRQEQNSIKSEATEKLIDTEITKLIKEAYEKCKELLTTNRKALDILSNELVNRETISGDAVLRLINDYVL
tara:strand:+ start:6904 stop:8652 length:1749 start_codon:yes stop_codon:yes gene_type:complete